MAARHPIETGTVFGRLTVIGIGIPKINKNGWKSGTSVVKCVCGEVTTALNSTLRGGYRKSCGCLNREVVVSRNKRMSTHGKSKWPEFKIWDGMKQRCENPNHRWYHRYGGRGITVCERWRKSFENFLEDMGRRPFPELTLERKNNDLGYSKENCVWATQTEQIRNRSNTRLVTYRGEVRKFSVLCEELGIDSRHLWGSIRRKTELTESMIESARRRQAAVDRVGGTA